MSKIETIEQLRTLYPPAKGLAVDKQLTRLDPHCRRFISLSPFAVLATKGQDGLVDISPRGGDPGFILIEDDETLLLPDWPGNNRLDNLENILADPAISLIFLIPGVDETLRVHGLAEINTDEALIQQFAIGPKLPKTVLRISVKEAYLHCAKALMRSRLWDADAQIERGDLPSIAKMIQDQAGLGGPAESQPDMVARYRKLLY
ncbi:pyridoxamine 5'-phosphate oxidase family protein [Hwanghaeella grinnelliae]|uniref:Pyridoxamine 5'-phosphate oxidase family protein n=1 Tax=Hwanghaeella grinnelliae TaxID=2500179 RepID=A0A3S2W302_9PROT|nr:pyridoxamine 5'-phosphate oxidase family protein [Hwanghaeella grinnelliae]RVU34803.1 pyridoxamine 5'-phosphate oxidase family protein [Hwanghaeella grinnelliae]